MRQQRRERQLGEETAYGKESKQQYMTETRRKGWPCQQQKSEGGKWRKPVQGQGAGLGDSRSGQTLFPRGPAVAGRL